MSRDATARPRATPRRETRDVALLVGALTAALALSGPLLRADGTGVWWPAAAIGMVYLLEGRGLHRVALLAGARTAVMAVGVGGSVALLPRIAASNVAVACAYGVTVAVARRFLDDGGRAWGWRGPAVLGVLGPVLAAAAVLGVDVAHGVDLGVSASTRATTLAVADATAVMALAPLWVSVRVGALQRLHPAGRRQLAVLALVAAGLGWAITSELVVPELEALLMVTVTVPIAAAALLLSRAATTVVTAGAGLGVAAGLAATAATPHTQLLVQGEYLAACVLGFLVAGRTAAGRRRSDEDGRALDAPTPVAVGMREFRHRMSRVLRYVRGACVASMLVLFTTVELGWWVPTGDTTVVARLTPIALMLLVNLASRRWDARDDHSDDRQLIETAFDAVAVVFGLLVYASQLTYETVPFAILLLAVTASLRLPRRDALTVVGLSTAVLAAARLMAPASWAVAPPDFEPLHALSLVATPILLTALVTWGFAQLEHLRAETEQATAGLAAAHGRERAQRAELLSSVARLERTNEELTNVRTQLESFSSVVAHDLRSPIATARTFAAAMADPKLPAEAREQFRDRIVPNLDRAARLIERLYDYASTSTTQVRTAPVDLNRVVRGVLDDYSAALTRFGVTVRVPQLLPRIECDEALMAQVFANLIGNAIRYGSVDGRRPTIEITAAWQDDGLVVTIADDGPGMPADRAERLFAAGQRGADDSRGLGLGLATCRTAVQRHGGRIWAGASRLGGAAISFLLPATPPVPRRVLVVEDDPELRALYRAAIDDGSGVEVVGVDSLAAARDALSHGAGFALAVVDLELPDGGGVALLDDLARAAVPVHAVSVRTDGDDAARAAAHGATVSAKQDVVGAARPGRVLIGTTLGA